MSAKIKNDSRLCILNSAAKLFSKLGIDRTSTRDISKDSNANISLISYHFGGKEGLYRQVIKEFALKVQEQMKPVVDQFLLSEITRESFEKEIQTMVRNMINMRVAHPEISKILAREKLEGMPLSREVHEEIFYPLIQKFYELFRAAQEQNIVRKGLDPAVFFLLISEIIFGFYEMIDCKTSLSQDCSRYIDEPDLFAQQILQVLLTGVLV